ncbi:P-loop containing nucleoside triphosphate hydrolase protein [Mollisia scopiformis]|uniref:p-loop containing nucleoside triphosphate hydrolase protein n=1 Tax=Mollisia scopiformis TaxID=149040 RepID=A0A194X4V8_MOLSC|nr:P-loop containing nucleoside triphosphate hydrolase protein [Mollisia scopiformis]KUJ15210.1 P-loop containing nucleoside triphosphate hydrolase protein [Mollisia scopiformis]
MAAEKPPGDDFVLFLPPSVYGFNMLDKKWVNLLVDNMVPILWNKDAFESFALDEETKVLITALVTNKITTNMLVDIMSGKGNGLIVLLHGGLGIGKTLTAENVAEIVEKPLYRVTCGDIGTNAENVEKSVLTQTVVLLDEAEVFLQERSLEDLQRNALVSDSHHPQPNTIHHLPGILILTSNRVGTFDEAFKSRIQLALRYEPFNKFQRRKVWENFIKKIEEFEADTIESGDLCRNIDQLAAFDMNGRQIRNAMTTARQLAKYQEQTLDFKVLRHVINVSGKFDNYLKNLNKKLSDENLAREEPLR